MAWKQNGRSSDYTKNDEQDPKPPINFPDDFLATLFSMKVLSRRGVSTISLAS